MFLDCSVLLNKMDVKKKRNKNHLPVQVLMTIDCNKTFDLRSDEDNITSFLYLS